MKVDNLLDILKESALASPEDNAFLFLSENGTKEEYLTYGELYRKVRAIAKFLIQKNLCKAKLLMIYPAGLEFIAAFLGCLCAGVVPVCACVPFSSNKEIKYAKEILKIIANDADIDGILTQEDYQEEIQENLLEIFKTNNQNIIESTSGLYDNSNRTEDFFEINYDAVSYIQYTSGSTSNPKGVTVKLNNLNNLLRKTGEAWNFSKESITLYWITHTHAYGLLYGLLSPIYFKSFSILVPTIDYINNPSSWLKAISKYKVTHTGAPSSEYQLCANLIKDDEIMGVDLSSWQTAVVTGEPIRFNNLVEFYKRFKNYKFSMKSFCPTYGMSEAGIISTKFHRNKVRLFDTNLKEKNANFEQTVEEKIYVGNGSLLEGLDVIIIDSNTLKPAQKGTVGEICVSGVILSEGYWNKNELNEKTFNVNIDGKSKKYLRTGDFGFIDNGELVPTGRLKEIIILYGKKHYPLDLEYLARSSNSFISRNIGAAFSFDVNGQEEVVLVQEIEDNLDDSIQDQIILSIINAFKSQHGQPVELYAVVLVQKGSIPRTNSGKVKRLLCKEMYLNNKLDVVKIFDCAHELPR